MQKSFFLYLALCLPLASVAQSQFSLQPIPASGTGTIEDYDVSVAATITNLTADVLNLNWERRVISLTPGCFTSIADPYLDWAPISSNRNLDLMPNETGPLNVHFYNNNAPCSGIVHLKITNRNNPVDTLIGVYLYNQNSGVKGYSSAGQVKLYPNPVSSFFSLENSEDVASIRIINAEGREIARFGVQDSNIYPVDHLPAQHYIMVLEDKNGSPFQVMGFLKQ